MELGPTVAGQRGYQFPADYLLPVSVALAGTPLGQTDRETVRRYEDGSLILKPASVFYESADEEGTRTLYIYPTPTEGGDDLVLEYVYEPPALSVDEPTRGPTAFPTYWHPKLRHFAAEVYYETVEDNLELAEIEKAKAEAAIGDLLRYDNERRGGGGNFTVGIAGITT